MGRGWWIREGGREGGCIGHLFWIPKSCNSSKCICLWGRGEGGFSGLFPWEDSCGHLHCIKTWKWEIPFIPIEYTPNPQPPSLVIIMLFPHGHNWKVWIPSFPWSYYIPSISKFQCSIPPPHPTHFFHFAFLHWLLVLDISTRSHFRFLHSLILYYNKEIFFKRTVESVWNNSHQWWSLGKFSKVTVLRDNSFLLGPLFRSTLPKKQRLLLSALHLRSLKYASEKMKK